MQLFSKMIKTNSRCFVVKSFFGCFVFKKKFHTSKIEQEILHSRRLLGLLFLTRYSAGINLELDVELQTLGPVIVAKNKSLVPKVKDAINLYQIKTGRSFNQLLDLIIDDIIKQIQLLQGQADMSLELFENHSAYLELDVSFSIFLEDFLQNKLPRY